MYEVNDLIVYGNSGVCSIESIGAPDVPGFEKDKLYFVLRPIDQDCVIYTPVDTKVFMRPVISRDEAERLIDAIPSVRAEAYYNTRVQELTHHYQSAIGSHDCGELIELLMSIYAKKQVAISQKRKIGQVDERFMRQAEDLLYSEFSVALDIPKHKVQEYIEQRMQEF